ncbi:FAD-dependent oxidoreductase [Embleya sp. NPDC127516]|uniref:FAD-dependent oxidoreductase n=1 Tax=Embleya sp. NPDC127516 TaxID=3363990 RepID=UPI00380B2EC9
MAGVEAASAGPDPEFASLFPAASIIPQTVDVDDLGWHVDVARQFFGALNLSAEAGVRVQRHFELFEDRTPVPPYAPRMMGFEALPENGTNRDGVPRRHGCDRVWGWSFDCFFAEMPVYRRWLTAQLRDLGCSIETRRLDPGDVDHIDADVIVNCAGFGSARLFGLQHELTLVKGVLLYVDPPNAALVRGKTGIASYNYTPTPALHCADPASDPAGRADVYFYPRVDSWVLGGTRLRGALDDAGAWIGEEIVGPTRCIGAVDVPAAVIDLNRELIIGLTGVDVRDRSMRAVVGYRCTRDPGRGGVRLEAESRNDPVVVHNYGHGGSGVTLSWSCAVRVAAMLGGPQTSTTPAPLRQPMHRLLREMVVGVLINHRGVRPGRERPGRPNRRRGRHDRHRRRSTLVPERPALGHDVRHVATPAGEGTRDPQAGRLAKRSQPGDSLRGGPRRSGSSCRYRGVRGSSVSPPSSRGRCRRSRGRTVPGDRSADSSCARTSSRVSPSLWNATCFVVVERHPC